MDPDYEKIEEDVPYLSDTHLEALDHLSNPEYDNGLEDVSEALDCSRNHTRSRILGWLTSHDILESELVENDEEGYNPRSYRIRDRYKDSE